MSKEAFVVSVSSSRKHSFSKENKKSIELIEGIGVRGDAHSGKNVKHLYIAKRDPQRLNLRQVHLIHSELFDELRSKGFSVLPGDLGENITTVGIKLIDLPTNTILKFGDNTEVMVTGLRNPCHKIDNYQIGLMKEIMEKSSEGKLIRKTGIMSVVIKSGIVAPGDEIEVVLPIEPFKKLECV